MSDLASRLMSKVAVQESGCWMFTGAWTGAGYGAIYVDAFQKCRSAHVVSYELHIGPVPKGSLVCHTCDNKWCVNPDHLFLGDHQSNKDDEIAKGRNVYGSRQGSSKLKEEEVLDIKFLLRHEISPTLLAREYNVTETAIRHIKNGQNWGWLE